MMFVLDITATAGCTESTERTTAADDFTVARGTLGGDYDEFARGATVNEFAVLVEGSLESTGETRGKGLKRRGFATLSNASPEIDGAVRTAVGHIAEEKPGDEHPPEEIRGRLSELHVLVTAHANLESLAALELAESDADSSTSHPVTFDLARPGASISG